MVSSTEGLMGELSLTLNLRLDPLQNLQPTPNTYSSNALLRSIQDDVMCWAQKGSHFWFNLLSRSKSLAELGPLLMCHLLLPHPHVTPLGKHGEATVCFPNQDHPNSKGDGKLNTSLHFPHQNPQHPSLGGCVFLERTTEICPQCEHRGELS
jgi:hypothetical protein